MCVGIEANKVCVGSEDIGKKEMETTEGVEHDSSRSVKQTKPYLRRSKKDSERQEQVEEVHQKDKISIVKNAKILHPMCLES